MVRFKNRYMLLEVSIDKSLPLDDLHANLARAIKHNILLNFAECGLASSLASFQVKYLNPITKLCIIRTSREEYHKVWSAIAMVSRIENFPTSFNLLDLSVETISNQEEIDLRAKINTLRSKLQKSLPHLYCKLKTLSYWTYDLSS